MTRDALVRALVSTVVSTAVLGGCIDEPGPAAPQQCATASDCNGTAGEVCDEGVCWGHPPTGEFAAVLSPGAGTGGARTELDPILFAANGWMTGQTEGSPRLVLASTVRVRGSVTAPCPEGLTGCDQAVTVPAVVRFSRPSEIDDKRVVFEATVTGGDYQVVLPRPTELVRYQVTIIPADQELRAGWPSAAELLPPRRVDVMLDPAGGDDVRLELVLPADGGLRLLSGSVLRPPPDGVAGWRVQAEAMAPDETGGSERVSNIARVDATGQYRLWVPIDRGPVDLVATPPAGPSPEAPAPWVRRRGLQTGQLMSLPAMPLPPPGVVTAVSVTATGTNGGGDNQPVGSARVVARLDQQLGPDLFLVHRVVGATNTHGVAPLALWAPSAGGEPKHEYAIDVLPASGAEQASVFGWKLDLESGAAPSVTIPLDRREAIRGTILDEHGVGVAGATVGAAVSSALKCELEPMERMLLRALPTLAATTELDGSFVLWVDPKVGGTKLRFDVHVEPPPATAPSWNYEDLAPGGDAHAWQLPEASYVRGRVELADGRPAAETLVQVYERLDRVAPCSVPTANPSGSVALRAFGLTDGEGVVRLVVPRVDAAEARPHR